MLKKLHNSNVRNFENVFRLKKGKFMKNGIYGLFMDVKDFLNNGVNGVTTLILILIVIICGWNLKISKDIKNIAINEQAHFEQIIKSNTENTDLLNKGIQENRDKIHFRYFCLTNTLKGIHKVNVDTKTGELK